MSTIDAASSSAPKWQSGVVALSAGTSNDTKSYTVRVEFEGGVIMVPSLFMIDHSLTCYPQVNPEQLLYVWDNTLGKQTLVQAGSLGILTHLFTVPTRITYIMFV